VQAIVQADRARRLAQSENAAVRCPPDGAFSHSTSLGARRNVYVSTAKPTSNGINPAR
jgi:hypothetical protein